MIIINQYHAIVLSYLLERKDAELNELYHDLHHDMPKAVLDKTVDYLMSKHLMVEIRPETIIYEISGLGKETLQKYLKEEELKKQPPSYHTHNTTVIEGNSGNVYNQSSFNKSFNPEKSNSTPATKSKITVESILKVTAAIITLALAVLKGCKVI
jgi:hypothetical protein